MITAFLLVASACGSASTPVAKGGPASDVRTAAASPEPSAKGGSPPPIPGVVDPSVTCVTRPTGAPMVLVGWALYEVADPIHPRLLCKIASTATHLYTADTFAYIRRSGDGTEVVLHSIGSGNESVTAGWPLKMLVTPFGNVAAWTVDGNRAATAVEGKNDAGNQTIQIWLFDETNQPKKTMLYEFLYPLTDCVCRFGLPEPVLAFSPDGEYLVSGWPIGKGFGPLRVYRVADRTLVATVDTGEPTGLWSRTGHRLYVTARTGIPRTWTPEDGIATLDGASAWMHLPGLSPDGSQVVYTAFADLDANTIVRSYVYDISAHKTRLVTDRPRSEVVFVKNGWVWYRDEQPCTSCPGPTGPTDRVFAMDFATGAESAVVFAPGESPAELQTGWAAAQFWPNL